MIYLSYIALPKLLLCAFPLTLYVTGSADGTGAGVRAAGGPGFGEKVFRRRSTGFESFR